MSQRGSTSSSKDVKKCGICSKQITDKDIGVQCELCGVWYHGECQDVSKEAYKMLTKNEVIHWFCKMCDTLIHNKFRSH